MRPGPPPVSCVAALVKLAEQAAGRRLEALEAKSRSASLSAEELEEFQQLIVKLRDPRRARRVSSIW